MNGQQPLVCVLHVGMVSSTWLERFYCLSQEYGRKEGEMREGTLTRSFVLDLSSEWQNCVPNSCGHLFSLFTIFISLVRCFNFHLSIKRKIEVFRWQLCVRNVLSNCKTTSNFLTLHCPSCIVITWLWCFYFVAFEMKWLIHTVFNCIPRWNKEKFLETVTTDLEQYI